MENATTGVPKLGLCRQYIGIMEDKLEAAVGFNLNLWYPFLFCRYKATLRV